MSGGRVLFVDDDRSLCEVVAEGLSDRAFELEWATDPTHVLDLLDDREHDCVVLDVQMPRIGGLELAQRIAEVHPDIPVVVVTAFGSLENAIHAIRAGAYDYVTKPFELAVLAIAIERALSHRRLRREVLQLRRRLQTGSMPELVGESPTIRALEQIVLRVAPTHASVLLCGETGTGKELVAQALHRRSERADHPFIASNCAALPESLLESELFGHVRGAFTGASRAHRGLFAQAQGGTLFLDEIADLPISLQPKLLRVLQERTVRPVGAETELPVDVRLVTATNVDLEEAVERGSFREDLLYRIQVVRIDIPPLRARGRDVLLLAQHFIDDAAANGSEVTGLTGPAADRLLGHRWPGNVRELQNAIARAVALARHDRIVVDDLPASVRADSRAPISMVDDGVELLKLAELERRYILHALDLLGGNRTLTAKMLGLDRKTLYRKLKSYGV